MMTNQNKLMFCCPAYGTSNPFPSHAEQYREYHGKVAWLVNPWTGKNRDPKDIGSDPFGHLISDGTAPEPDVNKIKQELYEAKRLLRTLNLYNDTLFDPEFIVDCRKLLGS